MDPEIGVAIGLTVVLIVVTAVLLIMQRQDRRNAKTPPSGDRPAD